MRITTIPSTHSSYGSGTQKLHSESLMSLCKWWESTHEQSDPLPHICHEYTSPDKLLSMPMAPPMQFNFVRLASSMLSKNQGDESDNMPVQHALHGAGRSLGLVGISLGVLFMLLIIAAISCLRRRKTLVPDINILSHTHTVLTVQTQANKEDSPPDYSMVLRMKEEEEEHLPSYRQAVGKQTYGEEDFEGKENRIEGKSIENHSDSECGGNNEDLEHIDNMIDRKEHRDKTICSDHESVDISFTKQDSSL